MHSPTNPFQNQLDEFEQKIAEAQKLADDPVLGELAQQELISLRQQQKTLQTAADLFLAGQEASDDPAETPRNCIIEIRGGAGGDEAKIWANDLQRMYLRFAEQIGLTFEMIDDLVVKFKGSAELEGERLTAFEIFSNESGVHRVQRVPETESQGRIHTSTASVAVLPEVSQRSVEIRDEDLEWQFMRSSGAGGQSVNKTSSAVRLIHTPTGLVTTSRQEKKQEQNRKIALELLRSKLWEIQEEERLAEIGDARSVIGRARRAEKIKTYNYPQNRVTDHRIKQSWHNLPDIMEGNLTEVIIETRRELQRLDATETESVDAAQPVE